MEIEIKRLVPGLAEDYLRFFDQTPHDDGIDEHKCYCICWTSADHEKEKPDFSTAGKRRAMAGEYVKSGALQGYLAYADGRPIGWCNANEKSACRRCESWLRFMRDLPEDEPGLKVKSVFCFVVAPEWRRKGIAARLLERVFKDAEGEGFDFVEAYPKRSFSDPAQSFGGPAAMFEKAGFTLFRQRGDGWVMRRLLGREPRL